MKQETIERLRGYVDSEEDISVVLDKSALADILAVLEAAETFVQTAKRFKGNGTSEEYNDYHDAEIALLALFPEEPK